MSAERRNERFDQVVTLNEAAKELLVRSAQVNLLALDAMVQSKRGGGNLRGFDEVSSQMRMWSKELHQQLRELGELSASVLLRTSLHSKQRRKLELLEEAARCSDNADAQAACERSLREHQSLEATLARDARRTRDLLSDIDQLGMMAIVLSRSAMIEAASGDDQQRAQLNLVSQEFYRNSEAVLEILKATLNEMRSRSAA